MDYTKDLQTTKYEGTVVSPYLDMAVHCTVCFWPLASRWLIHLQESKRGHQTLVQDSNRFCFGAVCHHRSEHYTPRSSSQSNRHWLKIRVQSLKSINVERGYLLVRTSGCPNLHCRNWILNSVYASKFFHDLEFCLGQILSLCASKQLGTSFDLNISFHWRTDNIL